MTSTTVVSDVLLRELAVAEGVCPRPVLHRVTDTLTGVSRLVPIRCGATRETVCEPCAHRNRRLRMQQCREGWHLDHEPNHDEDDDQADQAGDGDRDDDGPDDDGPDDEAAEDEVRPDGVRPDEDAGTVAGCRRVRSTRRREDVPELPRLPVASRTVGRTFAGADGKCWRPSMFVTLTLPSYGRVGPDGTPLDPDRYDYRRAGLDAMHFPRLVDRFWQNLRRATGYRVQYFAAVEPQRRLAPHLHAAIRGAIPRRLLRQVAAATYHQVWWPAFDHVAFTQESGLPVWADDLAGYLDPGTGEPLPTWEQALDRLDAELDTDPEAGPAHVLRFGMQLDLQGLIATSSDADRRVGYLTKYLTKSIADSYGDPDQLTPARAAHLDRLHEQVRWLPCSSRCWNWLRYGIQPEHPAPGMLPGCCPGKAHRRDHLGCGGRRVLVSRLWTGKTLSDHAADRATVVREALAAAGIAMPDQDRCSATVTDGEGRVRFVWKPVDPTGVDPAVWRHAVIAAIRQRQRWRRQYEHAKTRLADTGDGPPGVSATPDPVGGEAA
jgi:hypothetical protein